MNTTFWMTVIVAITAIVALAKAILEFVIAWKKLKAESNTAAPATAIPAPAKSRRSGAATILLLLGFTLSMCGLVFYQFSGVPLTTGTVATIGLLVAMAVMLDRNLP
jgi:hypothetical protein